MIKRFSRPNNKYWGGGVFQSEWALTVYWQRRRKRQNLRQELGHNDLMSCGPSAGSAWVFFFLSSHAGFPSLAWASAFYRVL